MKKSPDNLEQLFRQSFNDLEKINGGAAWNMPSDAVWNQIQTGLGEDKERPRRVLYSSWIAVAASVLLVISSYQVYQNPAPLVEVVAQVIGQEGDVNLKDKTVDVVSEELGFNKIVGSPKSATDITSKSKFILDEIIDNQLFTEFEGGDKITSIAPKYTTEEMKPIAILPLKNELQETTARTIETNPSNLIPTLKSTKNIYWAAQFNLMQATVKSTNNSQLALAESTTEGFSTGLQIGKSFKNGWTLETGLNYTNIKTAVNDNRKIAYQDLITDQENLKLNVEFVSSSGAALANIVTTNTPDIGMNESVGLNVAYSHNIAYLDIPLLVGKNWKVGRWNIGVKTGLLNRFELNNKIVNPQFYFEDNRFQILESSIVQTNSASLTTASYLPYFIASIGLEYYLNANLSLFLEPTFASSLKPLMSDIYAQNKSINMGMRYHL